MSPALDQLESEKFKLIAPDMFRMTARTLVKWIIRIGRGLLNCQLPLMKYLSHYGPSLCVKFYEDLVYAACGPFLHVYNYHTGQLLNKCQVFHRNKIHGICINRKGSVLLYGANSLSLVTLQEVNERSSLTELEKSIDGWITSGEFSYSGDQLYLLTSYNKIIICDESGSTVSTKCLHGEKSILYSGSITVYSPEKVYVNAGTVMGGIIIWDLYAEEIVHNLKGHEGSIFYVTESADGRYVASCSDDRSVRLWNLETGELLSVGWGHTARIWNLKFFDGGNKIISISEDCTCRVWDIRAEEKDGKLTLNQASIFEVHLTKNIWGVDVDSAGRKAVTAGNDGRIKLIDLAREDVGETHDYCHSIDSIAAETGIPMEKGEIIKGFAWFDFGLVAISSAGKILQRSISSQKWRCLAVNDKFKSYSITHGLTSEKTIVFANNKSDVLLLRFTEDGDRLIARTEYHCSDLSKTTNCLIRKKSAGELLVILESPNPRDRLVCLTFDLENLGLIDSRQLVKPENFVSTCLEFHESLLLIGSRFSTLAIFDLKSDNSKAYVIRGLTPGDTTTSIKYVEDHGCSHVFSVTNRDGYYNMIKIDLARASRDLSHKIIHSNKIVRGFLEGADFDSQGDYIIHGFKSSFFYIYNESSCYEVFSHLCGGAHRQWKLFQDSKGYVLIYIKASNLHIKRFNKSSDPDVLCTGIHGREIRDITVLKKAKFKNGYLFCTASEDTTLKLMHVDQKSGCVKNYWTQRKHVSGLQRCKFINESLMISCSAREELFLWEIDTQADSRPYIALRQTLQTSSTNPDLRIMDFDVMFVEEGKNFIMATVYSDSAIKLWFFDYDKNSFSLILEGFYQTCCLLNVILVTIHNQLYLIASATDGHLIYYNISRQVPFEFNQTDNSMSLKDMNTAVSALPPFDCRLRVHQSGIKTVDPSVDQHGDLLIFTGGDDNAVGITTARFDQSTNRIEADVTDFKEKAASSTVTSCDLIDKATKLLTTSIDQTLRLWDVRGKKLVLLESSYTTIADTGSSDSISIDESTQLLLVGGVGLTVGKLDFKA